MREVTIARLESNRSTVVTVDVAMQTGLAR